VNERKELLNMLREMWQKGNSPLRRIYSSWEELEANVDIKTERVARREKYSVQSCPNCGVKQRITKPLEDFFPYQKCKSCKQAFYVNRDLTVRELTEEEKDMPSAWVQIVGDISEKKLAVVFRLE
jgi:predicted RNA-binding Zn-ribbon protein involved in translation (DUF1610 family)